MNVSSTLISVLIRTKNRPNLIIEALKSVEDQSYRPIEVIIVNDGGVDIQSELDNFFHNKDLIWKYYKLSSNVGRSNAANKAMELALGKYFLFLDDDDLITREHLTLLEHELSKPSNNDYIGAYSATSCVITSVTGEIISSQNSYAEEFDTLKLGYENYLPIHSVLFHRRAYDYNCRFDSDLDLYEDWHFWLQVIKFGSLLFCNNPSALYRVNESGIGQPGQNKNYPAQWSLFLKKTRNLWSEEQLNHLVFSARSLKKYQSMLHEKEVALDNLTLELKNLQIHHQDFNAKYNSLEAQHNRYCQDTLKLLNDNQAIQASLEILLRTNIKNLKNQITELNLNQTHLESNLQKIEDRLIVLENRSLSKKMKSLFKQISQHYRNKFYSIDPFIFSYIHEFFRLTFSGQFSLAITKFQRKINLFRIKRKLNKHSPPKHNPEEICILTTPHTQYVGELLKCNLLKLGFPLVRILDPKSSQFGDQLHFVVCPQMFSVLPGLYISFQMEQCVTSRWFTKKYFTILENSLAIIDYSQKNIQYLQETGGLSYKQLFWAPISNINNYSRHLKNQEPKKEYDIVFYGDPNNERRRLFLDALKNEFNVLIISEVFGKALYEQLQQARIVVNIHYYEHSLLETTRIYECLSLGLEIISESSSDISQHLKLKPYVTFTEINNVEEMITAVREHLKSPPSRPKLEEDNEKFLYYFARMLMAVDLLPKDNLNLIPSYLTTEEMKKPIALTLPETYKRHQYIRKLFPNSSLFPGLRHFDGWIGAALSFKLLSQQSLSREINHLVIFEDDVELDSNFNERYQITENFLFHTLKKSEWDIFCGLIADVSDDVTIQNVYNYKGVTFIELDKMTSMVFNIYNQKSLNILADWDPSNINVYENTIDRYLENKSLRVITTLPFLVGHLPEHTSSIWHFKNDTYNSLISSAEEKLAQKLEEYKKTNVDCSTSGAN